MFKCSFLSYKMIALRKYSNKSTIFSLSSGFGKCGVSIIRVSGPKTLTALRMLMRKPNFEPKPRYAVLTSFFHPKNDELIDKGLMLWFPGPRSFTGEDCCEFQVHGSLAVISAMTDALAEVDGLRMAKAGEFTKRAFFSGKLDLIEVEGLADLIHAETEAQRKQALLQSTGSLSKLYNNWRQQIIRNLAYLEAYIDFAEDENIEANTLTNVINDLQKLKLDIELHLNNKRKGEMLRDGVRTVIIGEPNVGKSSLLNILCQKPISIVTPIAGTTRDIIETSCNIAGYPVVFADTAGLRKHTTDIVEKEGILRAINHIKFADLVILLIDANDLIESKLNYKTYKRNYLTKLGIDSDLFIDKKVLTILNKIDLVASNQIDNVHGDFELCSCKENLHLDGVLKKLENNFKELCGQPSVENPRLTQARYRENLNEGLQYLTDFLDNCTTDPDIGQDLAIAAQKIRQTMRCIEKITGHVSTDEILDVVFRDFCIGK